MNILIAPDSFKESLSAVEVAEALADGARAACPDADIDLCPMADGGEGTVAAMVVATAGRTVPAEVTGPLGRCVRAEFGLLGETAWTAGRTLAVIEMAGASGLPLVSPDQRDPMRTTTFGTGELIIAALDAGATDILVGIGGSATVDGGCGCAQAIGVSFADAAGRPMPRPLAGGRLLDIEHVDLAPRDARIEQTSIGVACDVTNPLTGANGAAAVYGPQKGATPEMVEQLEAGLAHLAEVIRRDLGIDVEPLPGAGAAGGLGAGLVAFADAQLRRGVAVVAEAVSLRERLGQADLCLTGEGRLDAQSLSGKTAVGVAGFAKDTLTPVVCVPGQADLAGDAESARQAAELFAAVRPLVGGDVTVAEALARPRDLLRLRAKQAVRHFLAGG